ncbi:MAG TPA: hypothetical protein VFJ51_13175, partial [Nitrososphaeraceae archaeon]|nr:hypothetical protein [Nitrososphaeraceae archaeon]
YPLITYEFQKIFQNLASEIKSYKSRIKEVEQKKKKQNECEHQFGQPRKTIYGFYGRQCIKCSNIRRVKESVYKLISELETALNDNYTIEEIQPVDYESNTKPTGIKVSLISPTGKSKTIRGTTESHALRDFIIGYKKGTE